MSEVAGKILRWSTLSSGSDHDEAVRIMVRCREEFPEERFRVHEISPTNVWVEALLLHERGCGWGGREGEGQREMQRFADAMQESIRRWRKRQKKEM